MLFPLSSWHHRTLRLLNSESKFGTGVQSSSHAARRILHQPARKTKARLLAYLDAVLAGNRIASESRLLCGGDPDRICLVRVGKRHIIGVDSVVLHLNCFSFLLGVECVLSVGVDLRFVLRPEFRRTIVHRTTDVPSLVGSIPVRAVLLHLIAILILHIHIDAQSVDVVDLGVGLVRSRSSGSRSGRVDLRVKIKERLLGILAESGATLRHSIDTILENTKHRDDVFKTASRDDVITSTLVEGLANRLRPAGQIVCEFVIDTLLALHVAENDLLLHRAGGVVVFDAHGETLKERLVHDLRTDELVVPILATLSLTIGGSEDVESRSRVDVLIDLLEEHGLPLHHGLKAHDLVGVEVHLVKQQDRSALHGDNGRAINPHRLTIDKTETAEEIVLISFLRNIGANELAAIVCTNLLNHRGLAVTRQTRDVNRKEAASLHDLLNVLVRTVGDVAAVDARDKVLNLLLKSLDLAGQFHSGSRRGDSRDSGNGRGEIVGIHGVGNQFGNRVHPVREAAGVILHDPQWHRQTVLDADGLDLRTLERGGKSLGAASIKEGVLTTVSGCGSHTTSIASCHDWSSRCAAFSLSVR